MLRDRVLRLMEEAIASASSEAQSFLNSKDNKGGFRVEGLGMRV